MIRRPACDHEHLVDHADDLVVELQLREGDPPGLVDPASEGVGDGRRLLVDLLEHEGRIAALLCSFEIPLDLPLLQGHFVAVQVGDHDRVGRQIDDPIVVDGDDVLRVPEERRDVGGQEVLALPTTDHER